MSQEFGWQWCDRCEGLWFGDNGSGGACPAGGPHEITADYDYTLNYDNSGNGGSNNSETDWRWCWKCQGLWYAADGSGGACPAGGRHRITDSNDYILNYSQQNH